MTEIIFFFLGSEIFQTYYILVLLFIPLFFRIWRGGMRKILTPDFFIVVVFSLFYSIIGFFHELVPFYYGAILVIVYAVSKTSIYSNRNYTKRTKILVYIFMLGVAIHALANFIHNISLGVQSRDIIDLWTGKIWSPTGQSVLLTPFVVLTPYFIFIEKNKILKISMVLLSLMIFAYVFYLGTRSQLVTFTVSLLVVFFAVVSRFERRLITSSFIKLTVVIIIIFIVLVSNIFNIRDFLLSSNLLSRFQLIETDLSDQYRWDLLQKSLNYLFLYPLGNVTEYTFAHNLWLDVSRQTGLIPFFSLILFTFISSVNLFVYLRRGNDSFENKVFLLSIFIGSIVIFLFEPILETSFTYFIFFIYLSGQINLRKQKHVISGGELCQN